MSFNRTSWTKKYAAVYGTSPLNHKDYVAPYVHLPEEKVQLDRDFDLVGFTSGPPCAGHSYYKAQKSTITPNSDVDVAGTLCIVAFTHSAAALVPAAAAFCSGGGALPPASLSYLSPIDTGRNIDSD